MDSEQRSMPGIIGADIGGTFTDIVYYTPSRSTDARERLSIYKLPSTPVDPAQGLLAGLQALQVQPGCTIIHGSTVATNALLERKGAHAALVTTEGFADVLEI